MPPALIIATLTFCLLAFCYWLCFTLPRSIFCNYCCFFTRNLLPFVDRIVLLGIRLQSLWPTCLFECLFIVCHLNGIPGGRFAHASFKRYGGNWTMMMGMKMGMGMGCTLYTDEYGVS